MENILSLGEAIFTKRNLSSNTLKTYKSNLKHVIIAMDLSKRTKTLSFLKKTDKVMEVLSVYSGHSLKNYLITINSLVDDNKKFSKKLQLFYNDAMRNQNNIVFDEYAENKKNEKEEKEMTSKDELIATSNGFKSLLGDVLIKYEQNKVADTITQPLINKVFIAYEKYLVSLLYLKEKYTLRLEHGEMKIGKNNKKENSLDISSGTVFLNKFKNVKSFGSFNFKLSDETISVIREFMNFRKENGLKTDYLLYNIKTNNSFYSTKRFSEKFKNIMGMTLNSLRKVLETDLQNDPNYMKLSVKERSDAHKGFVHSMAIGQLVYFKK